MNKQRREIIKSILDSQPFTSFRELEAKFPDLSSMTIRRDIDYFEEKGDVIKVRGGARSVRFMMTGINENFYKRRSENILSKRRIATAALDFVSLGSKIFFDAGTTVMCLASFLPDEPFDITTNCPNVAFELLKRQNINISIIGGTLNRTDLSISGVQANKYVDSCEFDISFIAPTAFSEYSAFTTRNPDECEIKKRVVRHSSKTVALIDSSKLLKSMPYTFAALSDISVMITDMLPPQKIIDMADEKGVQIIVAGGKKE